MPMQCSHGLGASTPHHQAPPCHHTQGQHHHHATQRRVKQLHSPGWQRTLPWGAPMDDGVPKRSFRATAPRAMPCHNGGSARATALGAMPCHDQGTSHAAAPGVQLQAVTALAGLAMLFSPSAMAESLPSIPACEARTSCVSTTSFRSPSQYLPPWLYGEVTPAAAQQQLRREMEARGASFLDTTEGPSGGYLHARMPYSWAGVEEVDDVEFVFKENVVLFRSQATGPSSPDPPFCWTPGCISGPRQRARLEALRDALGWQVQETDEDKSWVQILLH